MTDFLLFLGRLNLAMGAAIILVYLLRRPLRDLFGAPIAYAIWVLVPIASLASLLPPREASPSPTHLTPVQYPVAPMSLMRQIAHPALHITEQLTKQSALVHPVIAARAAASNYGTPDYAMLFFAAWALGAVLMALYLARLQARFHVGAQLGEVGPAVLGFFRPRIVVPDNFREQFTAAEQAAILTHERVHLARQDARINALAALLRCFCWFNPLVHLGVAWLRIDQELACDATAVAGSVSRRDYANALVKSQMVVTALPLGCNWPGSSQHPLIERVALLKRKRPSIARRITGTGLVILAATSAGIGAWAAQPPSGTNSIARPQLNNQIALATSPATIGEPNQDVGDAGHNPPVASANPTGGNEALPSAQSSRLLPTTNLIVPSPDLPQLHSVSPALILSNESPTASRGPQSSTSPSPVVALYDQSGGPEASMAPAANTSECAPPKLLNSLPLENVPDSNTMTVATTVEGNPEKLQVGIGDASTQLWISQAKKISLPVQEGRRDMDAGGRFSMDVARVARFTLGSMETGHFDIQVMPDPDYAMAGFDGVLGTDMMHSYDIDLDFAHRQLNYFLPEECKGAGIYWSPSTTTSVEMVTVPGIVWVRVTLDGHMISALLDTGADRTFLNPQVAEKLFGLKADALEGGNVKDGGALIKAGMHTFSSLTFGGLTVNNPQIAIPFDVETQNTHEFRGPTVIRDRYHLSDILPPIILGMDVLRQTHLYISFRNNRVYVSPAGDGQALKQQAPTKPIWFNVWRDSYDPMFHYLHPFVTL
jgi:beta-lactamase regulating signal transducer with metallopeptidase domain